MNADSESAFEAAMNKRDAKNALALKTLSGKHESQMGDMRAQMVSLTSALATLTATINDNGGGNRKRAAPNDCKSDTESSQPQTRKKGTATYKKREPWAPGMWFRNH